MNNEFQHNDAASNVVPLIVHEDVLDQASLWLVKLEEGLSEQETAALKLWLKSEHNRTAFMEVVTLWDKMSVLSQLSDIVPHTPENNHTPWKRHLAMAATALLVGLLSWQGTSYFHLNYLNQNKATEVSPPNYSLQASTKAGEHKTIELEDGSILWLNTNSHVSIAFTDTKRVVHLIQGELHIDVAKEPMRPLNVLAAGKVMEAVGTAFNVQYHQGDLELLVTEGIVKVNNFSLEDSKSITRPIVNQHANALVLTQGQKSLLSLPKSAIEVISQDEMEKQLSWREGKIVFRGDPLLQVIDEVSRYTDKEIVLGDASLANLQVAGLFNTNDVDALLATLADNLNIHTEYSDEAIVLRAN
ncbi:FecR domain-containing protein [Alteromonas sp. CI.11.F.A3]|uniref:FecR family protein n=1 Tax=Alteromonas sp. CI.11.F.A3 TaxID=3079555 RepID=UPI0029435FB8|nr:FecR domain-containing protein [Alteromonas sp. CI.11.F.A3]WOI37757.1 FecR domain-containing protein [Alteromonas sp. CI.11.F.A3]